MKAIVLISLLLLCSLSFAGESLTLRIKGMTCPFCAGAVEKQIRKIPQVESVSISLSDSKAEVKLKEGQKVDIKVLEKAVVEAGFSVEKAQPK